MNDYQKASDLIDGLTEYFVNNEIEPHEGMMTMCSLLCDMAVESGQEEWLINTIQRGLIYCANLKHETRQ